MLVRVGDVLLLGRWRRLASKSLKITGRALSYGWKRLKWFAAETEMRILG
jgi:hypothetical protein